MASHWHRWQLTAPLAALSRPIRTVSRPVSPAPGSAVSAGAAADGVDRLSEPSPAGIPVLLGGARARQHDSTTCAAAVLVMLAATGDEGLARWLETGELPEGRRPREIPQDPGQLDAADRFAAAQRTVKARATRRSLGPLPWPGALGVPPWTAAREARFPGVRYRVRPVDDSAREAGTILAMVEAATHRGHPVPLYVGGDLRGGLTRAVPRHAVLAVPPPRGAREPGMLQIYDPATGSVHAVATAQLLGRTDALPALGGWTHVTAALLPVPA